MLKSSKQNQNERERERERQRQRQRQRDRERERQRERYNNLINLSPFSDRATRIVRVLPLTTVHSTSVSS